LNFNQAKDIFQDLADNHNHPHAQYQLGMYFYCDKYRVHELKHNNRLIHKPMKEKHMKEEIELDHIKGDVLSDNGSIKDHIVKETNFETDSIDEDDIMDENEANEIAMKYFILSAKQEYHNAYNMIANVFSNYLKQQSSTGENMSEENNEIIHIIMKYLKIAAEWKFHTEDGTEYGNMYAKLNYGRLLIKASKEDSFNHRELRHQGLRHLFGAISMGLKKFPFEEGSIMELITELEECAMYAGYEIESNKNNNDKDGKEVESRDKEFDDTVNFFNDESTPIELNNEIIPDNNNDDNVNSLEEGVHEINNSLDSESTRKESANVPTHNIKIAHVNTEVNSPTKHDEKILLSH